MDVLDFGRFEDLRRDLFLAIKRALARDGHCKSYEGQFSVVFPNYFESLDTEIRQAWTIRLDCYVIGPNRHYTWYGRSFAEALDAAESDVRRWIAQDSDDEDAA